MSIRLALPVTTLLLLAVTACSPSSSQSDSSADSSAASQADTAASGTIRYESWTPTQETLDKLIAGFNESDPDVEVEHTLAPIADYQTSLQAQLRSGGGPDVFVVEPGAMFAQYRQYFEPLDDYAATSIGEDWSGAYRPETLARGQHDGQTLGLPIGYGVAGFLWVNRTVLDRAGVPVPTSYEELVTAARDLKNRGIAPIALGAKDTWQRNDYFMSLAAAADADALYAALEGSGSWKEPALVDAFADWQRLFEDGVVQDGALGAATYNDTYNLFVNGKAAFLANGSWNLDMFVNSLDAVEDYEIDAVPMIAPGSSEPAPVVGDVSGIVVVNKNSDNKAAAYRFAEYLSYGGGGQIWANAFLDFPVTTEPVEPTTIPAQAETARASIETMIEENMAGYRQIPSPSVSEELAAVLGSLAAGSMTPEEAAAQVQHAADSA